MCIRDRIIVGIDPSLTSTGICTMDEHGKLLSTLAINSEFVGMKRLHDIKRQLEPECSYNTPNENEKVAVFIEGYSFGSMNGREALGELGGMIRLMPVSYTHLRAHETPEHLGCRLLLEKKKR